MKYEVRDDARQEIIQKQDEIFEMKKTRHNAARQEVYRWDRLRNELEEKIERHKQSTTKKGAKFSDEEEEEEKKNDNDEDLLVEDDHDNTSMEEEDEETVLPKKKLLKEVQSSLDEDSDDDDEPPSYDYADEPSNKGIAKLADDIGNDMDDDEDSM